MKTNKRKIGRLEVSDDVVNFIITMKSKGAQFNKKLTKKLNKIEKKK